MGQRLIFGVLKSSSQGEFHPKALTEPYVIVSHHTAPVVKSLWITGEQGSSEQTTSGWLYTLASANVQLVS